ncbi:hypothetical protein CMQ_3374 [Grosmannia clavigera kw1407]|uniref:Uncharacterized protein n=1 Tax=Grosmannia clavigera (strain kw1407 / UAMH 11150) TaxID=655863 RepID=F0X8W3_GROCL|nr:uncharacterized protein CMQ_3374 [Grosmannia clavigera kw1407]EFX05305.1 hypothetical protein CMQ_3374 [Grosmannia clavigera kw1407]
MPSSSSHPFNPSAEPGRATTSALAFAPPLDHTAFAVVLDAKAKERDARKEAARKQKKEEKARLKAKTAAVESDNASIFSFSSFGSTTGLFGKKSKGESSK